MGTPEDAIRTATTEEAALPDRSEETRDRLAILSGTGLNIGGLAVFVVASFGINVLVARAFGADSIAFGQIFLITNLAFAVGAATRFGMDAAAVRRVAVETGRGHPGRGRAIVRIAVGIALVASVVVAVIAALAAGPIADLLNVPVAAMRAAAAGVVFVAIALVYTGASQGLKIMRHTLYAFWVGQSIGWIAFTVVLWSFFDRSVTVTVWSYGLSWVTATVIAFVSWRHATRAFPHEPAEPGEAPALIRFGAPRAPAALLSQALFYTDLFMFSILRPNDARLSVYAASLRVAQGLILFLTAVSYMFSPFVADLYERGLRDRLNALFKQVTRWTLSATIPVLLLLLIAPAAVLQVFGASYASGSEWLRVVLIGQAVNVSVGAAGYVLIMVGRTGWDLTVYAASVAVDIVIAALLIPHLGPMGAAIAQCVTLVFSNVFRILLVWRFVRIEPYDRHYARLVVPTLVGAAVMLAVHAAVASAGWFVQLAATGLIGGAAYAVAFLFFGLTPSEKTGARKIVGRLRGRAAAA